MRAIKKSILLFKLLVLLLSSAAAANQLTVSVTEQPRAFNIKGQVCLYNTNSKSSLNDYTIKLIAKQLLLERTELAELLQIKLGFNLESANKAPIIAAFDANTLMLEHDYAKVGNDMCTRISTSMPINQNASIERRITFPLTREHHWITTQQGLTQKASEMLQKRDWPINNAWIQQSTRLQAQFSNAGKTESYYTFDLEKYGTLLTEQSKTVFISVKDVYQSAIKQYFSEQGFKITDSPKDAYWNLVFSITPSADNLTVNVSAASDKETINLRNQPVNMASTNTTDSLKENQINKLINVYLTMMALSEQLSFNIDDTDSST